MPYVETPVNKFADFRPTIGAGASDQLYFTRKGSIRFGDLREAHLEYRTDGPVFTAGILAAPADGASTDSAADSATAGKSVPAYNVIVIDTKRSLLQRLFDWIFRRSIPFKDVVPLSERQASAYMRLEQDMGNLCTRPAEGSGPEQEAIKTRFDKLARQRQAMQEVDQACAEGKPECRAAVLEKLQLPLVADMVWDDSERLLHVVNLCSNVVDLLELARTCDPAGKDEKPGIKHLLGQGPEMTLLLQRALIETCKDESLEAALAALKPFFDDPGEDRKRLFADCKHLRRVLFSKVSTLEEALKLAAFPAWDGGTAIRAMLKDEGLPSRLVHNIADGVGDALPPGFAKVDGEPLSKFRKLVEVDLPTLLGLAGGGTDSDVVPMTVPFALCSYECRTNLVRAHERYHEVIAFDALSRFLPELEIADVPQ
ncbi:hypothetical protein [Cupriavidus sp. AU9028]|uniref:hypothetical protein n=1 Tax=Cupriavidus sp. AU9028 TaxID=2871157 RepID=UPI001C93FEB4|nr:hypothetical protein [Cupriavidus sp. AU9028]MBY4899021.1 hypothetical protein [Cupriavidus sp. AU9028]